MRALAGSTIVLATLAVGGIACGTLLGISPDDSADAGTEAGVSEGGPDSGADGRAEAAVDAAASCDADTSSDRDNCGACGTRCSQECEAGACSKTVFVTSTLHVGDFGADGGAVAAGAAICNSLAAAAGLRGTYQAWIADIAGKGPADRFARPAGPYRRVDGALVAPSFDVLIDGGPASAINQDEDGGTPVASAVWTGTSGDGKANTSEDCVGFTRTDIGGGFVGLMEVGANWDTLSSEFVCTSTFALYCFEQ